MIFYSQNQHGEFMYLKEEDNLVFFLDQHKIEQQIEKSIFSDRFASGEYKWLNIDNGKAGYKHLWVVPGCVVYSAQGWCRIDVDSNQATYFTRIDGLASLFNASMATLINSHPSGLLEYDLIEDIDGLCVVIYDGSWKKVSLKNNVALPVRDEDFNSRIDHISNQKETLELLVKTNFFKKTWL